MLAGEPRKSTARHRPNSMFLDRASKLVKKDLGYLWGFPKIRGTFLGVPIIRTIVFRGLYWGPLI